METKWKQPGPELCCLLQRTLWKPLRANHDLKDPQGKDLRAAGGNLSPHLYSVTADTDHSLEAEGIQSSFTGHEASNCALNTPPSTS